MFIFQVSLFEVCEQ